MDAQTQSEISSIKGQLKSVTHSLDGLVTEVRDVVNSQKILETEYGVRVKISNHQLWKFLCKHKWKIVVATIMGAETLKIVLTVFNVSLWR